MRQRPHSFAAILTGFTDYLIIVLGAAVYALSVSFFTAPNNIAPGGITGIATLLHYLIYVPIGTTALILNIPLFIWGAIKSGTRFIIRTVIASSLVSVFIDLFALFSVHYEGDRMIAAIFGGILSGIGLGIVFLRGGSTGGTDIIGRNLHDKYPFLSVGSIILISDAIVIVLSSIVYKSLESGLYAIIAIFVSTKLIDAVVFGFSRDNGKLLIIITADPDRMAELLTHDADRGVTVLAARGGYSGAPKGVILCATHPRDVYRVKSHISTADPTAFVITTNASAISGLGFTD
ncbi:MAG: YitT family protein [Ruminococcus sp.]|nr:YitT family protein [Ruminococcus sp.]